MVGLKVDERVLLDAAQWLYADLGKIDDLGSELSNTIANIYYRFQIMSSHDGHPFGDLQKIRVRSKDDIEIYRNTYEALVNIIVDVEHISGLVEDLRGVREENYQIYEYLVEHMLDKFKYRVKNADNKTAIRRKIERRRRNVNEIDGLYDSMTRLMAHVSRADVDRELLDAVYFLAASMIGADGHCDQNEIVRVERIGRQLFPEFDAGEFEARLADPPNWDSFQNTAYILTDTLSSEQKMKIFNYLKQICLADREITDDEHSLLRVVAIYWNIDDDAITL